MRKLSLLLLAFCLMVSGCSSLTPNVREYDGVTPLGPDEGYVIFGAISSNPKLKFEFTRGLQSYVTQSFVAGLDYHMMILPSGDYRLSSIYANTVQFSPDRASRYHGWDFHVEPGKINYFGEMVLRGNSGSKRYQLDEIKRYVSENFPMLAAKYEIAEAAR